MLIAQLTPGLAAARSRAGWPVHAVAAMAAALLMVAGPSPARAAAPPAALTDADYDAALEAVRARLGPDRVDDFHTVKEAPFIIASDAGEAAATRWATGTVRWAVSKLKERYFTSDPHKVLTVWLFRSGDSYQAHAKALFGHEPTTPYGYYSPAAGALIMNIATGGGTLVHEIVHPLMEANFPAARAWFNEGLGSLYEQSSTREGRIVGLTNWRLAGLQGALRAGPIPTFRVLTHTSDADFYEADPGTHYSQARYLCYYLQEHGLLERFFREYQRTHRQDPTGYKALVKVLGNPDMSAFEAQWRTWVLALRFEG